MSARIIPNEWMPAARMQRVIVHWTAGTHKASGIDRAHYHIIVEGDGTLVRGLIAIDANGPDRPAAVIPAAHTRNCNTGSIGLALACMGGPDVRERPFAGGQWPMTRTQWDRAVIAVADLCRRYGIPVGPTTVLSHAEVEPTLGIRQLGKWDITVRAFDPKVTGARAVGDIMRAEVRAAMEGRG